MTLDEKGKVSHVVIAYHDVSARREAQSALLRALKETREANDKIHGILRSAADGILVTDAENNLVLINSRAEELIGILQTARQPFERSRAVHDEILATGAFLIFVARVDVVMEHHDGWFV